MHRSLRPQIRRFAVDTSGAVAVDWIVLTAAIAGIGMSVMAVAASGLDDSSTDIKRCLKIQGNIMTKDNGATYAQRLKRTGRRCGRL